MKIRSVFVEYTSIGIMSPNPKNYVLVRYKRSVLVKLDACCCRIYGHVSTVINRKWCCKVKCI